MAFDVSNTLPSPIRPLLLACENGTPEVNAADSTPGIAAAKEAMPSKAWRAAAGSRYRSDKPTVPTTILDGSKPGLTSETSNALRINNPAPIIRTSAKANSETTSALRMRSRDAPSTPRASIDSLSRVEAARTAGGSPNNTLDSSATENANN